MSNDNMRLSASSSLALSLASKDAVPIVYSTPYSELEIYKQNVLRLAFRFATAQDLLRRAYDGMHKGHWAEGESETELCQAIRDFLDESKGISWLNQ